MVIVSQMVDSALEEFDSESLVSGLNTYVSRRGTTASNIECKALFVGDIESTRFLSFLVNLDFLEPMRFSCL